MTKVDGLRIHSEQPLNAEPALEQLREQFHTPAATFYVRSHGDVPQLDPARHRVRVDGLVETPFDFDVAALGARFPPASVDAVLQCAGNRRADFQPIRQTTGDKWDAGAIGHARWTGVRLTDVLRAAGIDAERGRHVAFDSADVIDIPGEDRCHFGVSVPIEKAMAPDVLLATAMNGETLRAEHGAPIRAVVPGYAGVRSAKWLRRITVRSTPSDNHMQQRDYKMLPANMTPDTVDWSRGRTIDAMPLTSAICVPARGEVVPAGPVSVRGYAIGGDHAVTGVELSTDGGARWSDTVLEQHGGGRWSWRFWHAEPVLAAGRHELVVRAFDASGARQPSSPASLWNFKGYLCVSWHRVAVTTV